MRIYDEEIAKKFYNKAQLAEPIEWMGANFIIEEWKQHFEIGTVFWDFSLVQVYVPTKTVNIELEINRLYEDYTIGAGFYSMHGTREGLLEINFITEDSRGNRKVIHTEKRTGKIGSRYNDANFKIPLKFAIPENCSITHQLVSKVGTAEFTVWYNG